MFVLSGNMGYSISFTELACRHVSEITFRVLPKGWYLDFKIVQYSLGDLELISHLFWIDFNIFHVIIVNLGLILARHRIESACQPSGIWVSHKMWLRQSQEWFLRGFLPVFHRNKARSSVKWTIRRHISEIPLSTTLNPNQTNKQTNILARNNSHTNCWQSIYFCSIIKSINIKHFVHLFFEPMTPRSEGDYGARIIHSLERLLDHSTM